MTSPSGFADQSRDRNGVRHSTGGLRLPRPASVPLLRKAVRRLAGLDPVTWHSSGGKSGWDGSRKMGDKYLRRLLVVGMTSLDPACQIQAR